MKICLISGSMPPLKCGVGYYTNRLLDTLAKSEEVSLITTKGLGGHPYAKSVTFVGNWRIQNIKKIIKAIRLTNPDIIHIQYPAKGYARELGINFLPFVLKLKGSKIPIVLTLHEYFGSGFLGKTRNLITAWFTDKIFVSNPYDLASLPKHLRKKAQIVPIGSSIPVVERNRKKYSELLKTLGALDEKPVVFFGFPFANKGLEVLINSAIKNNFSVLFLCEFDKSDIYQKNLLNSINEANSKGAKLYVTGFLDDISVSEVLQESELFVLPHSFPLTAKSSSAIAAAVNGVVIVSTAAKNPELNLPYIDEKNSILLKSMNEDLLGEAITSMSSSPQKLQTLKQEVKNLRKYFSWQNITDMHRKNYEELKK